MAVFYQEKPRQSAVKPFIIRTDSLDLQGRGVGKAQGRTWFIPNLMPGEEAKVRPLNTKDHSGTAEVLKFITVSQQRREPDCPLIKQCGGCTLQHLPPALALDSKVAAIARLFNKNCGLKLTAPDFIDSGAELHYRRACRLAVRINHGRTELGLRGRYSHDIVPLNSCAVLTARLNALLPQLTALINTLQLKKTLGHVELIDSDGAAGVLLRLTAALQAADKEALQSFGAQTGTVISVVEPGRHPITGAETLTESLVTDNSALLYLDHAGCRLNFLPSAFVQVNKEINARLVERVLQALPHIQGQKVLDLFCGLGNFSFALAAAGAEVVGVDIVKSMISNASANAAANGIKAAFVQADLAQSFEQQSWAKQSYAAAVLDPGRQGAQRAALFLGALKPGIIVMISCNPLAAARDSAALLHAGYQLTTWGVCDMFPRTAHIELMLVFALQE